METQNNVSFGQPRADLASKALPVVAFENMPTLVPGKPGFDVGTTICGIYSHTKRVYSDKLTAGKKDAQGRIYRDLHILSDATNRSLAFGIWSVGALGPIFAGMTAGAYVELEYKGRAEEALKPGQHPPHVFGVRGVNADGTPVIMAWDRAEETQGEAAELQ